MKKRKKQLLLVPLQILTPAWRQRTETVSGGMNEVRENTGAMAGATTVTKTGAGEEKGAHITAGPGAGAPGGAECAAEAWLHFPSVTEGKWSVTVGILNSLSIYFRKM